MDERATHDPAFGGMAGRYATALFDLAREGNVVDQVAADLDRFAGLIAESADLDRLVRSPVFSAEQQLSVLNVLLERAGIGGLAANFLKLAATNRRLFAVTEMIKAYAALVALLKGEVTAHVTVAESLPERHFAALREALHAITGKHVALDIEVRPAILGGLIVKLGSRMIDASLKTKLNALRHAMKEVG
jgi:F-type H+-transporting ATPase subunit delta